jgi:LemA protein
VETVKGYMNFEKGTLEAVVKARSQAVASRDAVAQSGGPTEGSLKPLIGAESALKGALTNFFALSENYPELRASETMQRLQEELSSTENKVAFSRQSYNDQVMNYNNAQQIFPNVLTAGLFGHHPADLFVTEEPEAKKAVKVSF